MIYRIIFCGADPEFAKEAVSMAADILNENGIPFQIKICYDAGLLFVSDGYGQLERDCEAQPLCCLTKPLNREKLRAAILSDYRNNFLRGNITVRTPGGGVARIVLDSILYIEILGKELTIHTEQNCITAGISLTAISSELPAGRFIRCHRSFLVNLTAVRFLKRYQITLRDGTQVPVGKQRYKEIREVLLKGIAGRK